MASWKSTDQRVVPQAITDVSTVQNLPLGTIIGARHETYGAGEFIYLKGATSTAAGSWVTYNMDDGTTTLLAGNAVGPVAIAMAANDASTKYGWYQISGKAVGKAADVNDNANVYVDSVPGQVDDAVVVGDYVFRAKFASDDDTATGTAEVEIERPFITDQDQDDT